MNSATHIYIRPQNINNKSMYKKQNWTPSVRRYPHWHLFSSVSFFLFFFFYSCFPVTFYLFPFSHHTVTFFLIRVFLLLFFRGKIVTFFLFFYLHPDCYLSSCYFFSCYFFFLPKTVTFFPVTFFPVTFFPSTEWYTVAADRLAWNAAHWEAIACVLHQWVNARKT